MTKTDISTELEPSIIPMRKEYVIFTDDLKRKVVDFVREHGRHVKLMARLVNVSPETIQEHFKRDPVFRDMVDEALAERNSELEAEARRRAIKGVTRKKWDKDGNLLEEEQVYSDRLMEKLLEADMPDRFRNANPFAKDGQVGGVLLIPVLKIGEGSAEDMQRRLDELSNVQRVLEDEGSSASREKDGGSRAK